MTSVRGLIDRLSGISEVLSSVDDIAAEVARENSDVLLSLNRDQMLLGRDADGNTLTPSYLQDPYFKTPAMAESYAQMKYALEPTHRSLLENPQLYPDKDRNTPNLIVTGSFQSRLFITASGKQYTIGSTYVDAPDINAKYDSRVFGLAPLSREYFYRWYIRPEILKRMKRKYELRMR